MNSKQKAGKAGKVGIDLSADRQARTEMEGGKGKDSKQEKVRSKQKTINK